MKKVNQKTKIYVIAFIIPVLLQLTFFLYQLFNKILTLWNVVSTAMLVGIFINTLRIYISEKREKLQLQNDPDIVTGGSTLTQSAPKSKKSKIITLTIKLISMITALSLSVLFFNIHESKSKNLILINSTVLSQQGEINYETDHSSDETTVSETEHIEVIVEYEFDGIKKQALIKGGNTHKIYIDNLKIYVDQNGKFVADYGRIFAWKIEAIIFLCTAIALALITIFSLGIEFIAGTIFSFASLSIFFLVNSQFFENMLYNDISCFLAMFINVGLYAILAGFLTLIIPIKNETTPTPLSKEESMKNLKARLHKKYSNIHNDKTLNNSIACKCKNCGAEIEQTHKFCTNCGTKKD